MKHKCMFRFQFRSRAALKYYFACDGCSQFVSVPAQLFWKGTDLG